ncbi:MULTISPECIES: cysteine hydrolase family protein [unclassified Cupriavidus]|uniref:cysteine hydrolase family protein n=1 Tax=unclassified Cupriavidus TaxID=2640874 RepID=UPI001365432E|nr:cysteine hydrolase family protein [Cupriavidus sp. SW-Y-13]MWL89547.1 isochorismatase family protein [Cupriavidus sp. SW-Y-13]
MTTALIVIDVQQGLCEGEYAGVGWEGMVERINGIARRVREAGLPVIFVQHESASDFLKFGSPRWQLAPGLDVHASDLQVRKTTPDSFHNTDLAAVLQTHGVKELIICGMQSQYCVDTTTRRALALGYPVTLVSDGHTTVASGELSAAQIARHHNQTLAGIISFGPRVTLQAAADVLRGGA